MTPCDLAAGDLVAYLDAELGGARLEYVEAHVRACPVCQSRLVTLRETVELLRTSAPVDDDPVNRIQTMDLIVQEARRTPHRPWRPLLLVAAPIAVLVLALLIWPSVPTEAGFPLAALAQRVLPRTNSTPNPSTILTEDRLPGTSAVPGDGHDAVASFPVVVPARLPGNLSLVSFDQARPDVANLRYAGPHQLSLLLGEEPESATDTTVASPYHLVVIDGTEVIWTVNPLAPTIERAVWVRNGVQFDLNVLAWSGTGISPDDARQIIQHVIAAQDGAGS